MIGDGTDADFLNVALQFLDVLGIDLGNNCFNSKAYETDFWYTWVSNGKQGFLLDLIKRPQDLELRLEVYDISNTQPAQVIKQFFPLTVFNQTNGVITMGSVVLSNSTCTGTIGNITINLTFKLNGRNMQFIPDAVEYEFPIFPDVVSHYGSLLAGTCNGVTYARDTPMAYTAYPVPILLGYWQWVMLSVLSFEGTDLQMEIVGTFFSDAWLGTSYVYYQGTEYKLDLFDVETRFGNTGDIVGNVRKFSVSVETLWIHFELECQAPVNYFALLEQEGATFIHTTVLGSCVATDVGNSLKFQANGALLELKKV